METPVSSPCVSPQTSPPCPMTSNEEDPSLNPKSPSSQSTENTDTCVSPQTNLSLVSSTLLSNIPPPLLLQSVSVTPIVKKPTEDDLSPSLWDSSQEVFTVRKEDPPPISVSWTSPIFRNNLGCS